MSRPKRKQGQSNAEQAIDDLADLVVESFQDSYRSELEPFEAYAARVRARVYADVTLFRQRFHHGYHVLMDELSKTHPIKKKHS